MTTPSGLVVLVGEYDVHFARVTGPAKDLLGAADGHVRALRGELDQRERVPKQLAFGWVGSTGSVTD